MYHTPAVSRLRQRVVVRSAFAVGAAFTILAAAPRPADAQDAPRVQGRGWEFVAPTGALVPAGGQRGALKRGNLSAAQLLYVVHPALAFTATLGWARSRDIASADDPKLDVFMYDVGSELRPARWMAGTAVTFSPFVGAGVGARSYNYRKLDVDATHNLAAYGSAGGELGYKRVRLRLEVRDYMTGFKPLDGNGNADTRNDVVVMAGLRITRR